MSVDWITFNKELSKGISRIDFLTGNLWMSFKIYIVSAGIPIILGIQDMDRLGICSNAVTNKIIHPESGFLLWTIRFRGHAYIKWDPALQSHFIAADLHKLRRRFGHPWEDKRSNFLHRTGLDNTRAHSHRNWSYCRTLWSLLALCASSSSFQIQIKRQLWFQSCQMWRCFLHRKEIDTSRCRRSNLLPCSKIGSHLWILQIYGML